MNDDWRVRVALRERGLAARLGELLESRELEHDLERSFGDRVVVSIDGPEVFCYAGSRDQAERVATLVRRLTAEQGWEAQLELAHWHPAAERWEPPDVPEPEADPGEAAREHAERIAGEREESAEQGYPEFEVRVQTPGRAQAGELSARLREQGIPHVHRFNYVLIGATDQDSAQALAARVRTEAPAGSQVVVEPNQRAVYDDLPRTAFAIFGGLGG